MPSCVKKNKKERNYGMYDEINQKPIIRFLSLKGTDDKGRMLSDLWDKSDLFLEFSHNYIQWMFPLNERSKHHPNAPVLYDEDIQFIQNMQKYRLICFIHSILFYVSMGLTVMNLPFKEIKNFQESQNDGLPRTIIIF